MRFSEVIGQELIKSKLIDEVKNNKVSHAQLLLGKMGYGGLALSLAFAQYLFCKEREENDSCGKCASCLKMQKLQHPDLHFVYPTVQTISKTSTPLLGEWREQILTSPYFNLNDWSEAIDPKSRKPIISVHESDEIIKKLSLYAYEGGYKVMIIWMPEEMNSSSANKLLKILEEPPEKTVFLLVGEDQGKLLQTIISRVQVLRVPRVSFEETRQYLMNEGAGATAADSIAARAEGDLRAAKKELQENSSQDEQRELFIGLMRVCYKKNVLDMMSWAGEASALGKERQKQFLSYSVHMFRQSILKNYTDDQLTHVTGEEDQFLSNFAKFITGNNIMDFTNSFNDASYHIDRNANPKILFTNLCFQVMRFIHNA